MFGSVSCRVPSETSGPGRTEAVLKADGDRQQIPISFTFLFCSFSAFVWLMKNTFSKAFVVYPQLPLTLAQCMLKAWLQILRKKKHWRKNKQIRCRNQQQLTSWVKHLWNQSVMKWVNRPKQKLHNKISESSEKIFMNQSRNLKKLSKLKLYDSLTVCFYLF